MSQRIQITHKRYTAELMHKDGKIKLSALSNIYWDGIRSFNDVITEYIEFLLKVKVASDEYENENRCSLNTNEG